jgi:hypothetical protein
MLISACGPSYVWVKNGATPTQREYDVDSMECSKEARVAYSRDERSYTMSQGGRAPSTVSCTPFGNQMNCTEHGGGYIPPQVITWDNNSDDRERFWYTCMNSNGWRRIATDERKSADASPDSAVNSMLPIEDDGTSKYIVEAGGYCNESNDCVRGLACSKHKCVKSAVAQRPVGESGRNSTGAGGSCTADESCRSGLICSDRRCVTNFGTTR